MRRVSSSASRLFASIRRKRTCHVILSRGVFTNASQQVVSSSITHEITRSSFNLQESLSSPIGAGKIRRLSLVENHLSSLKGGRQQEWHSPNFKENETPEAKGEWLEHLLSGQSSTPSSLVDASAYLQILEGWAKSRKAAAPFKCEEWIGKLERHCEEESQNDMLRPSVEHYNAVISAWAHSRESVSVVRAERWLNKLRAGLERSGDNDDDDIESSILLPNTESYNLFLDACSKGHGKRNDTLHNNAVKAEETLKEMMKIQEERGDERICPNTDSFNYAIRAWTRCRHDITMADKVMHVLRTMELYQRTGQEDVKANTISYCMAIDAWGSIAGLKAQRSLKRLKKKQEKGAELSLANDADFGADEIKNAESILNYMHDLHDAGDRNVIPTTDAYNTFIGAFTRTANELNTKAPLAAERILRKMIGFRNEGSLSLDIQPDQRSYIHVMRAWGKVKRRNSGERAEWWLRNMWAEYDETSNEHVRPNVGAYNAVMEAYFHQANADKLEAILLELLDHEKVSGDSPLLHANTACFTFVIRGWLKHEEECIEGELGTGCEKALKWLDLLMDREEKGLPYASTSPELFTGIIKAAKTSAMSVHTTRVSKKVFKTMLEAFTEFRASRHFVEPNAYAWVLQVGLKALSSPADSKGRAKLIRHLAKACREDGFVSSNFISALANGPVWTEGWTADESKKMTKEIFGDWPLPKSWSRNIKRRGDVPLIADTRRTRHQPEDCEEKQNNS